MQLDLMRYATRYRCLYLDPPWPERGAGKSKRGADKHYSTIATKEQILDVILSSERWNPEDNAHLYMAHTDNYREWAHWLVRKLGFRYVRNFIWVKVKGKSARLDLETGIAFVDEGVGLDDQVLRMGIGQYARGVHEPILFAVRGEGKSPDVITDRHDIMSTFFAPVPVDKHGQRIHSRKPDALYELMEARTHGPRIEFFARTARPGWDVWGNQAPGTEG
jgi:N6-adenosine-specific RNA methylase IME4